MGQFLLNPKLYKMDTSNWNSIKVSLKQLLKSSFTNTQIIDRVVGLLMTKIKLFSLDD